MWEAQVWKELCYKQNNVTDIIYRIIDHIVHYLFFFEDLIK